MNKLQTFNEFADQFIATLKEKHADVVAGRASDTAPLETRHMFRPQRELLADAMAEAREFDGTRAGLQTLLGNEVLHAVDPYFGIDKRIGWDTYIVTTTHPAWPNPGPYVAGFINGPLVDG